VILHKKEIDVSGPNEVRLRLPTLEIFDLKSGAALSVGAGLPVWDRFDP